MAMETLHRFINERAQPTRVALYPCEEEIVSSIIFNALLCVSPLANESILNAEVKSIDAFIHYFICRLDL